MCNQRLTSSSLTAVWVTICGVLLAVAAPVSTPAQAQQPDSLTERAAEVRERIDTQGEALSLADEEFNVAQIARQTVEARVDETRQAVQSSSAKWEELKKRLSERARRMYMYPGAPIEAFLGSRSFGDVARAHTLSGAVLTADAELVESTELARQDLLARARRLVSLRDAAKTKEEDLAARRADIEGAVARQEALLEGIDDEIAQAIDAERRREASAVAPVATPTPLGDVTSNVPSPRPTDAPASAPPTPEPTGPAPAVKSGASKAVSVAAAQIGKPYEWAADGPDTFDCSGLTMYAWAAAGVSLPHSSRAQYASLPHVSKDQLRPGDLVFYGSPIHHMGIYEGGGVMINAPQTGEFVRRDSIERSDYAGAARP